MSEEQEVIDVELVLDKPLPTKIVDEVMKALSLSDAAAYAVYLQLSTRFGAGQRLWGSTDE